MAAAPESPILQSGPQIAAKPKIVPFPTPSGRSLSHGVDDPGSGCRGGLYEAGHHHHLYRRARVRSSAWADRLQRGALSLVKKKMDRFDVSPGRTRRSSTVSARSTAKWIDGTPFEGNRYVDRFVVRGGQIVKMDVWNDSAERILVSGDEA